MDWKKEKQEVDSHVEKNWWKPEEGKHKILFLDDGNEVEMKNPWDVSDDKLIKRIEFRIKEGDKEFFWSVSKGKRKSSIWGQIVEAANALKGLKGKTIDIHTRGQGKERQYMLVYELKVQ